MSRENDWERDRANSTLTLPSPTSHDPVMTQEEKVKVNDSVLPNVWCLLIIAVWVDSYLSKAQKNGGHNGKTVPSLT